MSGFGYDVNYNAMPTGGRMDNIIDVKKWKIDSVKREVAEGIKHANPKVELRWKEMALSTIERFIEKPAPNERGFAISLNISEQEKISLQEAVSKYLEDYSKSVEARHMEMLGEIIRLQREIAELEVDNKA